LAELPAKTIIHYGNKGETMKVQMDTSAWQLHQEHDEEAASPYYLGVMSTDTEFIHRLIDWLNGQSCKKGSTALRLHDMDPFEELDLRLAQIGGMTTRIFDLEKQLADLKKSNSLLLKTFLVGSLPIFDTKKQE